MRHRFSKICSRKHSQKLEDSCFVHQKTDWAQLGDMAAPGSGSLIIARGKPGSPKEPGSPTSPNHSAMLEN